MFAKLHIKPGSPYYKLNESIFLVIDQNITPTSHRITIHYHVTKNHHYAADFYNTATKKEFTLL